MAVLLSVPESFRGLKLTLFESLMLLHLFENFMAQILSFSEIIWTPNILNNESFRVLENTEIS